MRLSWCARIVGLVVASAACRHAATSSAPVSFADVREFKRFAEAEGLFHHTGARGPGSANNFFVADHSITFDDVTSIGTRRDCGLMPGWKGVLWVYQIPARPDADYLFPEPSGNWRVWGNVLVAGDEALMDRMEQVKQSR